MITIQNERLKVQIQQPGSGYQRSRFDWSGICQQITLDGQHSFLSQEATSENPDTEGVGLTDEFGIVTPIGYDEISAGEWFPKIGVGFLQKTNNDPYNFMADYPMRTSSIAVEQVDATRVTFLQESEIIGGWGWKMRKTFSLDGDNLKIDYVLENIGKKPLITEQYNHNFISVNSQTIGPDYQLQTSFPLRCELIKGGIQIGDSSLNLTEIPSTYIYASQSNCVSLQNVEWSLVHQPTDHGIRATEQSSLFKFALWGMSHAISPEFFVWVNIYPGEAQTWQRNYKFF